MLNHLSHFHTLETYSDCAQFAIPITSALIELSSSNTQRVVRFIGMAILNQGLLYIEKKWIDKKRPNGEDGSFPSGHTSGAFLGVGLSIGAKRNQLSCILFIFSLIVAVSRITSNHHDKIDVSFGALQGFICGYLSA